MTCKSAILILAAAAILLAVPGIAGQQHFHEENDDVAQIALVINAGNIRYAVTHPSEVTQVGDDFRFGLSVTGPPAVTAGQSTVTLTAGTLHGCTAPAGTGDLVDTGSQSNAAGTSRSITQRFIVTETECSGAYRVTLTAGGSGTTVADRIITFSVHVLQPRFTYFPSHEDGHGFREGQSVRACTTLAAITDTPTITHPDASTTTVTPDGDRCMSWHLDAPGTYTLTYTGDGSTRTATIHVAPQSWVETFFEHFHPLLWILFFWAVTMRMVLGGGIRYGLLWLFALTAVIIVLLGDAVPGWPMSASYWGLALGVVVLSLLNRFGAGSKDSVGSAP